MRSATSFKQLLAPYVRVVGHVARMRKMSYFRPKIRHIIENSEDQGLNWRVILKWVTEKQNGRLWKGSSGSGQGHIGAVFDTGSRTFGEFSRQLSDCGDFVKNSVPQI